MPTTESRRQVHVLQTLFEATGEPSSHFDEWLNRISHAEAIPGFAWCITRDPAEPGLCWVTVSGKLPSARMQAYMLGVCAAKGFNAVACYCNQAVSARYLERFKWQRIEGQEPIFALRLDQ